MLKLGSGTGSLVNHLVSRSKGLEPVVGMGATELMWTDRHALTIVEVNEKKTMVVVQRDNVKRIDNGGPYTESQDYEFTPNPNATRVPYTLRKNGAWVKLGESMKGGSRISIGRRSEYCDPSF